MVIIHPINDEKSLKNSIELIRKSFKEAAGQFNLTPENSPSNPAFITLEKLLTLKEKGAEFFGLFDDDKLKGFVAVEKKDNDIFYLERLAVLPEYRKNGLGEILVKFVLDHVKNLKGKTVSIGIINENIILKKWYIKLGFVEKEIRKFGHLPFKVCFLDKTV